MMSFVSAWGRNQIRTNREVVIGMKKSQTFDICTLCTTSLLLPYFSNNVARFATCRENRFVWKCKVCVRVRATKRDSFTEHVILCRTCDIMTYYMLHVWHSEMNSSCKTSSVRCRGVARSSVRSLWIFWKLSGGLYPKYQAAISNDRSKFSVRYSTIDPTISRPISVSYSSIIYSPLTCILQRKHYGC